MEFEKCGSNDIQLTLSGAANGGIIYIRGGQAACVHETTNETTFHVFEFDACGIDPVRDTQCYLKDKHETLIKYLLKMLNSIKELHLSFLI